MQKQAERKRACSEISPRRAQRRSKCRRNLRPTRNPGERLCREIARSAMQKQAERSEPVPLPLGRRTGGHEWRCNLHPTRNPNERLCREIVRNAMQKQAERSEPVPKSARAAPSGAVNAVAPKKIFVGAGFIPPARIHPAANRADIESAPTAVRGIMRSALSRLVGRFRVPVGRDASSRRTL